jgi:RimJ/RimL family protein N-acetyltransferase
VISYEWSEGGEIGYWLAEEQWGKGYGSEAGPQP